MKKSILLSFMLCVLFYSVEAIEKEPVRIACIGNSITEGVFLKNRSKDSYPGVLEQMLGLGYDLRNFGVSGTTALNSGNMPYTRTRAYKAALEFNPNIVTIKLGTNDTKPRNWAHKADFEKDLEQLINSFKTLPAKPRVIVCIPVPAPPTTTGINDSSLTREVIPMIKKVVARTGVESVDLYHAILPHYPAYFRDGVHPNAQGAAFLAGVLYKYLKNEESEYKAVPENPFPGNKRDWRGYDRYDFTVAGRAATVVVPKQAAPGNPWIWRPAFFGAFASADKALLEKGYHVAYYNMTHLYGSPRVIKYGNEFYTRMVKRYHLNSKVVLEGLSRGGLAAFNWAAQNTSRVACLYVDAPVCDLTSWPGRGEEKMWKDVLEEWNVKDEEVTSDFKGNAIHALPALAKASIPIIAVCGDSDVTVPYKDNMLKIKNAYEKMGGTVKVILKKNNGHHPHGLEDPTPIVDFILKYKPLPPAGK